MTEIVSPLLEWLNAHPQLAGLATFIISAAESVAIIGTIIPGSITMTAIGALAGAGVIPLWETIIWAMLGAVVGDGISYWLGYYFKDRLPSLWPFRNNPSLLKAGEKFVHKYGVMSVFFGRFVGPVRALVPLVAGMLGMKPLKFTIANVTSAIGWAPAYMLPGILLGAASLELPPDIAIHFIMVLLLITLFLVLCVWVSYKFYTLIQIQTNQLQNWIWEKLKSSRYFSFITVILKHYDPEKAFGQLSLALSLILVSLLLFSLSFYVAIKGPSSIMINDALFHLFRGIRNETLDNIMINITLLGQKEIVLPVVLVFFGWLIYSKRWYLALHVLGLTIIAAGGVFAIKHLFHISRPWGITVPSSSYSMPSGHTTLATLVLLGFAYLIAFFQPQGRRCLVYSFAGILVFAIGISRIYLGAHWFTDVMSGWLLSIAVLMFTMISYQRKREPRLSPSTTLLVTIPTFILCFAVYNFLYIDKLKQDYQQLNWPSAVIAMNPWWQKNDAMPAYHVSLFGFPSQHINIEWAGHLEQIKQTLEREGWSKPPARDWISTFHRLADISSSQYLPMVSSQYLDKKPELIFTRTITNGASEKKLLVIRLWSANRSIKDSNLPIWVGVVGVAPRSYSWLFKNRVEQAELDPMLVFPNKTAIAEWQWKIIQMNQPTGTKKIINQHILLIRPTKLNHQKR